jgi:excisionase family DNA binding protein
MSASVLGQMQPAPDDVTAAVEALPRVKSYLARHERDQLIRLVGDDQPDGEVLTVPRGAVELLATILAHLASGQGVSVVPSHAELTTQQAADMLNVSRPFLIGLLEAGEIGFRKVGKHRRVRASSLLDYLRSDDQHRREAADELSALTQDMGLV